MFFIERGAIYEEMRRHNAVFVGFDNQGKARHAHMKGAYTNGESFRLNVEGSDPAYGFGYCGEGPRLYVFEACTPVPSFPDDRLVVTFQQTLHRFNIRHVIEFLQELDC